jgi:predicted acyltransferase
VGKNPLPIYLLSELLIVALGWIYIGKADFNSWINTAFFQVIAPGAIGSLLFAVCYMLVCWLVGKILDNRKIYIRV